MARSDLPRPGLGQTVSVDYEVVTAAGVTVYTTPAEDLARDYVAERRIKAPSLSLEVFEVTITTSRRRVYRPRLRVVA